MFCSKPHRLQAVATREQPGRGARCPCCPVCPPAGCPGRTARQHVRWPQRPRPCTTPRHVRRWPHCPGHTVWQDVQAVQLGSAHAGHRHHAPAPIPRCVRREQQRELRLCCRYRLKTLWMQELSAVPAAVKVAKCWKVWGADQLCSHSLPQPSQQRMQSMVTNNVIAQQVADKPHWMCSSRCSIDCLYLAPRCTLIALGCHHSHNFGSQPKECPAA